MNELQTLVLNSIGVNTSTYFRFAYPIFADDDKQIEAGTISAGETTILSPSGGILLGSRKNIYNIHTTVADNVYATFKRAWNAGERNSIDKPQTERHVYKTEYPAMFAPPTQQQKKGDRKWPLGM